MFCRPKASSVLAIHCTLLMAVWLMRGATGACWAADWDENGTSPFPPASMAAPSGLQRQSSVPSAPMVPTNGARPSSWPGGGPGDANGISQATQPVPAGPEMVPCESARVVALVGSEPVLESDVMPAVNQWIKRIAEEKNQPLPEDQLPAVRKMVFKKLLETHIQSKLVYGELKREMPAEGVTQVEKSISDEFDKKYIDNLMKDAKVSTRAELEKKLRERDSSIDQERRSFVQSQLAALWMRERIKPNKEVTHEQMLAYYQQHKADFTTPARARWEELMVRFSNYPDKQAAYAAIAKLGNLVFLEHKPFAEVAKAGSDGATAANGGERPWTNKGSLTAAALDQALFTQNIGELGPILESPLGFHIIRVTQRDDVTVTPFEDAQVEINKKIMDERNNKLFSEYLAKLKAKTPVWTIYDNENPTAQAPSHQAYRR